MTDQEARNLGRTVAQTSHGVRVKFGKTNGLNCLHLISNCGSRTIYSAAEWDAHPANRPRKPRHNIDADLMSAVRNQEAK